MRAHSFNELVAQAAILQLDQRLRGVINHATPETTQQGLRALEAYERAVRTVRNEVRLK